MDTDDVSRDHSEAVENYPRTVSMIREKKNKHTESPWNIVKLCKYVRASLIKLTNLEDTGGNLIAKCTKWRHKFGPGNSSRTLLDRGFIFYSNQALCRRTFLGLSYSFQLLFRYNLSLSQNSWGTQLVKRRQRKARRHIKRSTRRCSFAPASWFLLCIYFCTHR